MHRQFAHLVRLLLILSRDQCWQYVSPGGIQQNLNKQVISLAQEDSFGLDSTRHVPFSVLWNVRHP